MNIKEMHYDFKQKINRADSQSYKNLRAPEIDWYLNEAQLVFVKSIMYPRQKYSLEITPRHIDDLNTLVLRSRPMVPTPIYGENRCFVPLVPDRGVFDFMYFIAGEAKVHNEKCNLADDVPDYKMARLFSRKHIDLHERNVFYNSSYEWREISVEFEKIPGDLAYNMILFTDGDFANKGSFIIDEVFIDYLKRPRVLYYGGYNMMNGRTPEHPQNCELPEHVHSEVVDIAVLLATGAMQLPDYQTKFEKIKLNNN